MASIMCPTPVRQLWLYRATSPGVWEVGFFDSTGDWCVESAHPQPNAAADRVHWLNGGDSAPDAGRQLDQADDEIARLQTQITTLTTDRDKWRNQALRRVRGRRTRWGQR